jgi:DNA repair exonuclease SbcCD ATPase subunit
VKLLKLRVAGFGPLRGEVTFDPSRATAIVDDNERGKSSLLAAIGAALYGLESDRRSHRVLTPLERWRPWDGGAYGVELEVESGGETYSIRRDFDRNVVEVMNGRGQDVTARFRAGKDEYPVGLTLLGLGLEEFERCAFVRQGELDQVVPGDEKLRRSGALSARLESAADTRGGDATATAAVRVLGEALKKYECAELEFTGTVDTAVQRLEAKRALLETQIHSLEHDLTVAAGPLEELARIAGMEATARDTITALDLERRRSVAGDLQRRVQEDVARRRELDELRAEAARLTGSAHVPSGVEKELAATIANLESAQQHLENLEVRRQEEETRDRKRLDDEMAALSAYAECTPEDADRLVALAAELRRTADEDARLRSGAKAARDQLGGSGFDPTRAESLHKRFVSLDEERLRRLRRQAELLHAYQDEVAKLDETRNECTERLRGIDAARNRLRLPGGFLVALGLGGAAGGVGVMLLHGEARLWTMLLVGAGVLVTLGIGMLIAAAASGREGRQEGLRRLTEAQRRLNALKQERAESEVDLADTASTLGYRDATELMREWDEYVRATDESAPLVRTTEQLADLETRRRSTYDEVRARLDRAGGGPPDPAHLERVASSIRHLGTLRQRQAELGRSWSWIDDERRVAQAEASGRREHAMRLLQSAGLTYDPARPWSEHLAELAARIRDRERHATLVGELIPRAESLVMPERQAAELKVQLDALGAAAPESSRGPRTPIEIDQEAERHRASLELASRRRGDLRVQVDEVVRRYNLERPELLAQIQGLDEALGRARRFKRAIELAIATLERAAHDTHRRWADFLNRRVAQILKTMGSRIEEVRFGEDLDFSVRVPAGPPLARGKAIVQLSAGARDQLHFAIRIAISEFVSKRDDALPLLVDDAFATSDDERARAGMRMLFDQAAGEHQILYVTCHRQRFEAMARLDPDLYGSRVQRVDVREASHA